jgi:hypothetical protein
MREINTSLVQQRDGSWKLRMQIGCKHLDLSLVEVAKLIAKLAFWIPTFTDSEHS